MDGEESRERRHAEYATFSPHQTLDKSAEYGHRPRDLHGVHGAPNKRDCPKEEGSP